MGKLHDLGVRFYTRFVVGFVWRQIEGVSIRRLLIGQSCYVPSANLHITELRRSLFTKSSFWVFVEYF